MIKAENVKFSYDDSKTLALNDVSLKVKQGEFLVIIGHNGSGKSTFAKTFNGILLPSSGKVYVLGMDTSDDEDIWEIRRNAGMVFQNPDNQIVATLVEEDVAFGPENLGIESSEIRERVDEALDTVRMGAHIKKPPHLLSGGQKQRIAIAGILAMKPKCIILDEPTAMLDPIGRKEVIDTILRLNKEENITIVHITHYMNEAIDADRVIVMEKGEKYMEGTPKEIFSQVEKLKSMGLDVPQVTMLAHELKKEGLNISDEILTVEEMVEKLCQLL